MVQEFHVVRCFSCQSFQVQQVKKVNRWSCKLCGEKQSLLKEYGRGSGADCRRHVQKLNAMRGAMMEEQEANTWSLWEQQVEAEQQKQGDDQVAQTQVSRWSKYLNTPTETEEEEEEEPEWNVLMDRQQLHGNSMTDREYSTSKRKRMEETDGWKNSCSPDQSTCLKRKPRRPSATNSPPIQRVTSPPIQRVTSPPSQRVTSPPIQRVTSPPSQRVTSPPSQRVTSPPSQRVTSPPSVSSGTASRCARFLSTDSQVQVVRGSPVGGWSQCGGGATATSRSDLAKPRPQLPVSSMFESGEDFNFDDDFLTCQRV